MVKQFLIPIIILCSSVGSILNAQIVSVGNGSYTTTFPGTDAAGRNGFPDSSPLLSGTAATKPVPTNDWWSSLLKNDIFGGGNDFAENLFNYPISMQTSRDGLVLSYIPFGVFDDLDPIVVGVSELAATKSTVSDFSDWTVTMNWEDRFNATSGIGMPFVYFTKGDSEIASIQINQGSVEVIDEMILISDARNGADFVIYAPSGSSWSQSGNVYTSELNDKNYWSIAMMPQDQNSLNTLAEEYKKYAYVFPVSTKVSWSYDELNSLLRTEFTVETDIKEGTESNMLMGLLPHQWDHLSSESSKPDRYSYSSVRGELKTLEGNSFIVENKFHGILPTLPNLPNYSKGFSLSELDNKVKLLENDQLATWTDSYNEGQVMNRLIQTARIAHEIGNTGTRDKIISTIKNRLEDWLTAEQGEVAFLFYYNQDWTTMLGYPAGHQQDTNINDHHFHWGYFIHAAAFLEQFEPGWADEWGGMIDLLIRDAASANRNDDMFPFLRNFSPYAGHCWANGMAAFPQGNDQESTSESMQFNSSLIHWGTITGNDEIRDLGIYLYTTEQTAIEEYWFDMNERIFPDNPYALVSRVWGNSYDNGTFWTDDIEASYGIELYPIHGGSMYLGYNISYAEKLWAEIENNTGILNNDDNVNLWHDTMWKYLSFTDPKKAIHLYDSYPDRSLKFGVSDAQTYYWIHSMNALGKVDASITADYPVAVAFLNDGHFTYSAHNYYNNELLVTFSDGYELVVPPNSMATSRDVSISGEINTSFKSAYAGGSVDLMVTVNGQNPTKVEYFDDGKLIGESLTEPFIFEASDLKNGVHGFYAKMYVGESFEVTNIAEVIVGDQMPYDGTNHIPGMIEAGFYDIYEGGGGQGITYSDVSAYNEGDFRLGESVDVSMSGSEGATIGWIAGGEWVEYSIEVEASGLYEMSFRFASGNQNGGGPFYLNLNGEKISDDIRLDYTGDWDSWQTRNISNIPFPKGNHILRLVFDNGEFNIGRMTFSFVEDLPYSQPIANAGENVAVIWPESTASLDGSLSYDEEDELSYQWDQIYGPSVIEFSDNTSVNPTISNLEQGVYKCRLTVGDGEYTSSDNVLIIVSETGNLNPTVTITSPGNNSAFREGDDILIKATASDLEGEITKVEFFNQNSSLGEDTSHPFEFVFTNVQVGDHVITAVATDEAGATGTSDEINITVNEVYTCIEASSQAIEGSFSVGYKATFESIGADVTVTFELLDKDKSGVVAFLREESPFTEVQMDHISGNIFTATLHDQILGEVLQLGCRFAFSGGQAATRYLEYEVGSDCEGTQDVSAPMNFSVDVGTINFHSVELKLNGTDDSGVVLYQLSYDSNSEYLSVENGDETSFIINGLSAETSYEIRVSASDLYGNYAENSPIVIEVTTTEDTNTPCMGIGFEAQLGEFEIGYNYSFETTGTDVKLTFELLDNKGDVFAYLWRETPFTETPMTQVSNRIYTYTLSDQTIGETIRYACKFEFAGGLAVTKYFSYVVGDDCLPEDENVLNISKSDLRGISIFPNPAHDLINIKWDLFKSVSVHSLLGNHILTSDSKNISIAHVNKGVYIITLVGINGKRIQARIMKH